MPEPISWIIIVICLLMSFFFSASETALACCNRFKISVAADEGRKSAKLLSKILDNYDRALTTVLIGNNIVAIIISSISAILFYNYLKHTGLEQYSSLISSIIMAFIVYILGDTLPKTIAKLIPDTLSEIFVYPIYFFMIVLFPITIIFELLSKLVDKIFKNKSEESITEEDIENSLEKAVEDEVIEAEQAEIVQSALEFIDTNVKEVLTPKEKIFSINAKDLNHENIQNIICDTSYSRIPVYEKNKDNIIGVLNVKLYFEAFEKNPNVKIQSILIKPYFVSSRVMIDDLFTGFKKHHTHIAFVRNNKKELIGMVTMEDVLEELVSDIAEPNRNLRRKN